MTDRKDTCLLYHNFYSLYSIMVRYTYALRGAPADPDAEIVLREEIRSIKAGELLTEHFLCNVNSHGEVPVLVPEDGAGKPIPDSVAITHFLAERYPGLMPEEQEGEMKRLLERLHEINFFPLTFFGKPDMQQQKLAFLEAQLHEKISERYRKAVVDVSRRLQSSRSALDPEVVQKNADIAVAVLGEVARFLEQSSAGWILDTTEPTALDAHVVVAVCRLQDIDRKSLIPEAVRRYAEVAMAQSA